MNDTELNDIVVNDCSFFFLHYYNNLLLGCFVFPEKQSAGGRVYAMASTGEVEKRVWVATSVSKNYPVGEIIHSPDKQLSSFFFFSNRILRFKFLVKNQMESLIVYGLLL